MEGADDLEIELHTDLPSNGAPLYSACVDPGNGDLRLDLWRRVVYVAVLGGLDKRRAQIPDLGADLRHLHALLALLLRRPRYRGLLGGLLVDGLHQSVVPHQLVFSFLHCTSSKKFQAAYIKLAGCRFTGKRDDTKLSSQQVGIGKPLSMRRSRFGAPHFAKKGDPLLRSPQGQLLLSFVSPCLSHSLPVINPERRQ